MFKRLLSLSLAFIICAACYVPTFAADLDIPADEPMNTEFQHIKTITTELKISSGILRYREAVLKDIYENINDILSSIYINLII